MCKRWIEPATSLLRKDEEVARTAWIDRLRQASGSRLSALDTLTCLLGGLTLNTTSSSYSPTSRIVVALLATVGFLTQATHAAVIIEDGLVNNVSTPLGDTILIQDTGGGDSTTVNLNSGGSTGQDASFGGVSAVVSQTSLLNVQGGTIGGDAFAWENSTLNISGGEVQGDVVYDDASTGSISGGVVEVGVFMTGSTQVGMSAGTIGSPANASTDVTLSGTAAFTMTGGVIGDDLKVDGSSSAVVNGGDIRGQIEANGDVGGVLAPPTIRLQSGSYGEDIEITGNGQVTLTGGMFPNDGSGATSFSVIDSGILCIIGSDFSIGTDAPFTPITDFVLTAGDSPSTLSGTLADGSTFTDIEFSVSGAGQIVLKAVPEPSSILLIGLVGMVTCGASRFKTYFRSLAASA